MSKVFFAHDQIQERPNKRYPTADPHQIHYHFRPARPANLCITLDPETGEVNASAGTFGPLTWGPYTMCLHINRLDSPHSYHNLSHSDECVVALPSRDMVKETWIAALPLPRGVNELDVAGLHACPSTLVKPPGVLECPVNFECKVEFFKDYHSHGIVFVRVLGATIDEEVLGMTREEVIHRYPTYEIDDRANRFGGSVERLGVMGEIFDCPEFPLAPKSGWGNAFERWVQDLRDEKYLDAAACDRICALYREYNGIADQTRHPRRVALKDLFTRISKAIVKEQWKELGDLARAGA
jgi:flavin reductase (DIM6/NTAB) family NADH-FMN oxidoreductase RutF